MKPIEENKWVLSKYSKQGKAEKAVKDTFKRIYSGNNKKMLDNLGKKPPTRKFPNCEKYGLNWLTAGMDVKEANEYKKQIEQALSRLEFQLNAQKRVNEVIADKGSKKVFKVFKGLRDKIADLELKLSQAEQNGKEQGKLELVELLEWHLQDKILFEQSKEIVEWLKSQIKEAKP
jgi:hypothetical protein